MIVDIKQWRELVPWNKTQLYLATAQKGKTVSIPTITNMENGEQVSRVKAQAVLDVLNDELLRQGKIRQPLQISDIERLKIA